MAIKKVEATGGCFAAAADEEPLWHMTIRP
jgi:hypothetical protein